MPPKQPFNILVFRCLLALGLTACGTENDGQPRISGSNVCVAAFLDATTTQFQVLEAVEACNRGGSAPPKPSPTAHPERICDQRKFLSEDAAKCLAEEKSLAAGIDEWRLYLSFDSGLQRVVWNVVNVVSREGVSTWEGQQLVLDAVDGGELKRLQVTVQGN